MQFEFYESKEKFLNLLQFKIKECKNNYIYEYPDEHHINIGFKRLGHNGGRWFLGEVICENNHTILSGNIKDVYLFPQKVYKNRSGEFITNLSIYIFMYLILLGILSIIWVIFKFSYIVLLILPIMIIIALRLNGIFNNYIYKTDKKFINFMINVMGCKYQNSEINL